jgi:hypothetical protein
MRARDLFEGAKLEAGELLLPTLTSPFVVSSGTPSRKRSLEEEDDSLGYGRPRTSNEYPAPTSAPPMQVHHILPPPQAPALPSSSDVSLINSYTQATPSFDRYWNTTGASNIGGPLSTSVLPQQFSTGLVNDRELYSGGLETDRSYLTQGRYPPQYWQEYGSLGQMGISCGVADRQQTHQQQQQQSDVPKSAGPAPNPQQQYYLPQHYNSFSAYEHSGQIISF